MQDGCKGLGCANCVLSLGLFIIKFMPAKIRVNNGMQQFLCGCEMVGCVDGPNASKEPNLQGLIRSRYIVHIACPSELIVYISFQC